MKLCITQIFTLLLLITLAVPAFAGKVLAEIEYFYSDDGTLTGKAFNGNRVNFEYDLRGQLLAVKDAQGKDLERYTYDPAGNRLSKTINGVTTTYTYDKANQLVTSTVNGVTTHYKYDAAGRMVQAGDKSYIYNGQNKVSEVRQNGKTVAKFEYNIDGQIAKAIYGDKVEEFIWDGLALIWRSGVTYINEPYVTGGNPVMAGDDVLFNDMLGSTLAVNDKAVEMTSFGETGDKNAFFTGKPMIDELGYSFLFRDYNPNQGKWTTTDPLGYPDGWNNLAYVNNGVTDAFDWLGGWDPDGHRSFTDALCFFILYDGMSLRSDYCDLLTQENINTDKVYASDANMHSMREYKQSVQDAKDAIMARQDLFISYAAAAAAQCIDEASAKSFCPELIKNLGIASHIFQDNLSPVHCPNGEPSTWYPGYLDGWTNPFNWINHFPEMLSNPSYENVDTYLKWLSNEVSQIIAGNKFIIKELFE